MCVAIPGAGYVGHVTGTCLADVKHRIVCVGIEPVEVDGLDHRVVSRSRPRPGVAAESLPCLLPVAIHRRRSGGGRARRDHFTAMRTPPALVGGAGLWHLMAMAQTAGRHDDGPAIVVSGSAMPEPIAYPIGRGSSLYA
ncbi:hypothetical protein LL962_17200 [Xanthomonas sp. NCPPB 1067]|uniref:hypothetical protein n=1 Tax=Xanthomonas TaxID=338 RepID=UPI001E54BDA9|nr:MULTISPECIES: hypothetical protein [Xanthomonas]MCC4588818.1 hypothetical protein [Xanthomonas sp. NCPPB 1067]